MLPYPHRLYDYFTEYCAPSPTRNTSHSDAKRYCRNQRSFNTVDNVSFNSLVRNIKHLQQPFALTPTSSGGPVVDGSVIINPLHYEPSTVRIHPDIVPLTALYPVKYLVYKPSLIAKA